MGKSKKTALAKLGFDFSIFVTEEGKPDTNCKARIIRGCQEFLIHVRDGRIQNVLAGLALASIYDEMGNHVSEFGRLVAMECGISKRTADRYMQIARIFSDIAKSDPNTLKMFTQNAMVLLASDKCPEPARKAALTYAAKGNQVNDKKAKEFVSGESTGAKKPKSNPAPATSATTAPEPEEAPDPFDGVASDIAEQVTSGEFKATEDELRALSQYELSSQRDLVNNVKDGLQTLATAVKTGEVVEPTTEQKIDKHNKAIEAVCRRISAPVKEFDTPWINEDCKEAIRSALKSALGMARVKKAVGECPLCTGAGCKECRNTGFLPHVEMELNRTD